MRQAALGFLLFFALVSNASAAEPREIELLLSGGMLYSLTHRSYKSLRLPAGWSVLAAAYSPDGGALAVIVKGVAIPPAAVPVVPHLPTPPVGPINKAVRAWKPSTRLLLVDRASGAALRSSVLAAAGFTGDWTLAWSAPTTMRVTASSGTATVPTELVFNIDTAGKSTIKPAVLPRSPVPPAPVNDCHRTLTETQFHGNVLRFIKDAASCSTPPETSDTYQLIRPNAATAKEEILWDYRVPADQSACAEPYACYTGTDAQFLSVGARRFLVWDGDLFSIEETEDGVGAQLITQLLPSFSHPWGIAANATILNPLDWEPAMPFQPVSETLRMSHGDVPMLYAQNFLPTRSFNATVEIGPYKKSVMVPAGTQVGPVEIGSFKDSAYTPVLSTLRWTSFHHRADPVYCKEPYTISANTSGMIVSIKQDEKGELQCQIRFQEDR